MTDKQRAREIVGDELHRYMHFTGPSRLDKSLHTLEGMLRGAAADGKMTAYEVEGVRDWIRDFSGLEFRHPFREIIPFLNDVLADGEIEAEEARDLLWLCEKLSTRNEFYDAVTADMQRLHGMLAGVADDGAITPIEIENVRTWMNEHEHLKGNWPYDELYALLLAVLEDGKIDPGEHRLLMAAFSEFASYDRPRAADIPYNEMVAPVTAFCAVTPDVAFAGKSFCFSGRSSRASRRELASRIELLGGSYSPTVRTDLDYLLIGGEGNPAWSFACYGRKVEQAMKFRKKGRPITLVHENDFWDALLDAESETQ